MRLSIRYAIRALLRDWKFSLAVLSSLAIACGSLSSVSALAFQVLLRPLDFPQASQLTLLYEGRRDSQAPGNDLAPGTCKALTALRVWKNAGCWMRAELKLGLQDRSEMIHAMRVTAGVLPTLGVFPAQGRWLQESDGENAVVISHEMWQSYLAGSSNVIGRQISLESREVTVVGVMPPGFRIQREPVAIYQNLELRPATWSDHRRAYLGAVGRLRNGVTLAEAQAEARGLASRLESEYPADNQALRLDLVGMQEDLTKGIRRPIQLLWLTASLLIVLAIFNVSNLLLTRASEQAAQFALRESLGATKWQMLTQPLTEALLLAVLGGIGGVLIAALAIPALQALIPAGPLAARSIAMDWKLVGLTIGAGIVVSLLAAAWPSWRAAQPELLRIGTQKGAGRRGRWLQDCLLAGQVALAALLLVSAVFLLRSWERAQAQQLGFQPAGVTVGQLHPGLRGHAFLEEVLAKLEASPGIASAALTSAAPLTWRGGNLSFEISGSPCEESQCRALYREVSPKYFQTLGIPLRAGQSFNGSEAPTGEKVVVVNATFARSAFGNGNPIGQALRFRENGESWRRIVGVVEDTRDTGVEAAQRAVVYVPWRQSTMSFAPPVFAVVQGNGGAEAIRRASHEVDWKQPVAKLEALSSLVDRETELRRLQSSLAGFFALSALSLATTGLHGLLGFRLARMRREMGIRVALGASSLQASQAVAGSGIQAALAGLFVGLVLAATLANWAQALLFGVAPSDPSNYLIPSAAIVAVLALVAVRLMREAAKLNPAEAIRDGGDC